MAISFPKFLRIGIFSHIVQTKINETTTITEILPLHSQVRVADVIARGLGVSYELIPPTGSGVGELLPNGSWTHLLGMLQEKKIDIAISSVFQTVDRNEAFLFSYPHFYSEITFITTKPEYVADTAGVLHPFSTHLWIAIVLCLCTMPVLLRALLRKNYSMTTLVMSTLSSFLNQGSKLQPKKNREYLMLGFWFLGIGFVYYSYTALLLSFLTFPTLTGIKDVKDLAEGIQRGKYGCTSSPGQNYASMMLQSEDPALKVIAENLQKNAGHVYFMLYLENSTGDSRLAYVMDRNDITIAKHFYFVSEDRFFSRYGGFPMHKDFCCKSRVDSVVRRLWETGFFTKEVSDYSVKGFIKRLWVIRNRIERNDAEGKLTLAEFKGPFIFLIASHILALFVLLLEIGIAKCKCWVP